MLESTRIAEAIEAINKCLDRMENMIEKQHHALTRVEASAKTKRKSILLKLSSSSTPSSSQKDDIKANPHTHVT